MGMLSCLCSSNREILRQINVHLNKQRICSLRVRHTNVKQVSAVQYNMDYWDTLLSFLFEPRNVVTNKTETVPSECSEKSGSAKYYLLPIGTKL